MNHTRKNCESKGAATIRRRKNFARRIPNNRSDSGDDDDRKKKQEIETIFNNDDDYDDEQSATRHKRNWIKFFLESDSRLFLGLLSFRLLNAWIIQTSYVPDEYWQSLEVAHRTSFGYGYLTWEWREGLRSYLYPFCFSVYFSLLGFLRLDNRMLLIKGPRLIQAVLAACGDLMTYKMSLKISSNHKLAQWTLFCQLTSWFLFYTCTRTLTNSAEGSLIPIALFFFPWPVEAVKKKGKSFSFSSSSSIFVILACTSVVVRLTSVIIWLPFVFWQVCTALENRTMKKFFKLWILRGFTVLFLTSVIDYQFYGKWTNVYYNFLKFNVLSNMADIYGKHPWHWYLTQGFPAVYFSHTVLFLMAAFQRKHILFLSVTLWTLLVYSCLGHKEFRFLSGTFPFVMHLCGSVLYNLLESEPLKVNSGIPKCDDCPQKSPIKNHTEGRKRISLKIILVVVLIVLNAPIAFYTCLIHQRGTIDAVNYVARKAEANSNISVVFLMPCHSTPFYSYVHRNISMKFLSCEPNLNSRESYTDEADYFYSAPEFWLRNQTWFTREMAHVDKDSTYYMSFTYLVMYESLYKELFPFLTGFGFKNLCAKFFHTHFPEGRVDSHIVVISR